MQKVVAGKSVFWYTLAMEKNTTTTVQKGISSTGFAYTITARLVGHRNQYFTMRGNKGEGFAFFHTSKDIGYLRRLLSDRY